MALTTMAHPVWSRKTLLSTARVLVPGRRVSSTRLYHT